MSCVRGKKDLTTWQMAYYSNGGCRPHSLSPSCLSAPSILSHCFLFSPSSTLTLLCLALLCECLKTSGPLLKYNINSIRSPSLPTLTPLIAAAGTYYCLWQGEVMTIYRDIYRCLYMYITIYTGPRWLTVGGWDPISIFYQMVEKLLELFEFVEQVGLHFRGFHLSLL